MGCLYITGFDLPGVPTQNFSSHNCHFFDLGCWGRDRVNKEMFFGYFHYEKAIQYYANLEQLNRFLAMIIVELDFNLRYLINLGDVRVGHGLIPG
jgi:hypothetical protein